MTKTDAPINFNITLQPKQDDLVRLYENSLATKIGFGGSRGGSKSHTSDDLMIIRRLSYPKTSGLIVMRYLDDIKDIHIRPMLARFPILDSWYHRQDKVITFPNQSFIRFISVENFDDIKRRAGRGFADILIDQSELFTAEELEFLYTINRFVPVDTDPSIKEIVPKTLLCFNPGGVGHTYHKRVFIEKNYEVNERASDFEFVQAFGWDNAYWCLGALKKDEYTIADYHKWDNQKRFEYFVTRSQYGQKLNQLPDSQRKAQLLGSFDVFEGQFFSSFRREHHVIPYQFNESFNRVAGLDYGNTTVLEILERDYHGTIVVAGEVFCHSDCETPTDRANKICDYLIEHKINKLEIIYDTDMDASQISNVGYDKTPVSIFRQIFQRRMGSDAPVMTVVSKTLGVDKKKGYRVMCNEAVRDYLQIRNKQSKLYFGECPELIRTLPQLIYDRNKPNGMDFDNTLGLAHCFDAMKMALFKIYTPTEYAQSKMAKWAIDWQKRGGSRIAQSEEKFLVGMD